jgi:O-antigen ligase
LTKLAQPAAAAIAVFFSLLAAVTAGGGLALPVLLCLAGAVAIRPSLLRQAFEKKSIALWLVLALTAWSIVSTAWSPLPMDDQVYKLAVLVPLGLMFVASATADHPTRRLTMAGALAASFVMAPLLLVEAFGDMPLNSAAQPNERVDLLYRIGGHGTTILLSMVWAGAAALIGLSGAWRWIAAIVLLAGGAVLSTQFDQLANALAFAVGAIAFLGAFVVPRLMIWAVTGGLAVWLVAAPFVIPVFATNERLVGMAPLSWAHRAGIWNYVSERVMEQPLIGHGLEASRAVTDRVPVRGENFLALPIHPHNASLQLWYETGAVGVLLAAAALIAGGLWLSRNVGGDRPAAAAAAATLATMGVIANVSYGIWAEWWMATLFLAAAVVGAVRKA